MYVCMYTHIYIYVCTSSHRNKNPFTFWFNIHEYTYVCIYICICIYVFMYVYIYIFQLPRIVNEYRLLKISNEWNNWSNAVHFLWKDSSVGKLYTFASFIRNTFCFSTILFMSAYTHVHICMYICMYVSLYVRMYVYIQMLLNILPLKQ